LVDVLPLDAVTILGVHGVVEVRLGVAVCFVGDQVDVGPRSGVFDRRDRLLDEELAVVGVFGAFEVRRPRVLVDVVGFEILLVVRFGGHTSRFVPRTETDSPEHIRSPPRGRPLRANLSRVRSRAGRSFPRCVRPPPARAESIGPDAFFTRATTLRVR
jgi:hypothetical protein